MTRLFVFIFVICMMCAATIQAQPAAQTSAKSPAPVAMQYTVFWGGIEAGKIGLTLQESKQSYTGKIEIVTSGFLKKFLQLRILAEGNGNFYNPTLRTNGYRYTSIRRKKTKDYRWVFDPADKMAHTPDNPGLEKIVGPEWRKNVTDPFGALFQAIRILRITNDTDSPTLHTPIPVFDGRRRFDVRIQEYKRHTVTIAKRQQKVVELALQIDPKAGFDKEDKEDDVWSNAKIQLFLTDDGMFYPLKLVASTSLGPAIIQLQGGCIGENACKPKDL